MPVDPDEALLKPIIQRNVSVLTLDIETTPHLAYSFDVWQANISPDKIVEQSRVIVVGWKWYGQARAQVLSERNSSHEELIQRSWDLCDQADLIVHYNGQRFDMRHLRREWALAGLPPPSPFKQVDLYLTTRRVFAFPSNKLDAVSQAAGVGEKVKHEGFALWKACMDGDEKAWRRMERYCLTPDHKFLGEDLRWKEISDFKVGDVILGFDESAPKGLGRLLRKTTITKMTRCVAPLYKVTLASGKTFRATPDHKWLVAHRRPNGQVREFSWIETAKLKAGHLAPRLLEVWDEDMSKDAGWLAGMLDGEGSLNVRRNKDQRTAGGFGMQVAQKPGPETDRLVDLMFRFSKTEPAVYIEQPRGPISKNPICKITLRGPVHEKLGFLGRVRPERLIPRIDFDNLGRLECRNFLDPVVNVERTLDDEVIVVETDTGTYVADGYPMHNCRGDVELTERYYDWLRPWIHNHPHVTNSSEQRCNRCGSANLHPIGDYTAVVLAYKGMRCADCGGTVRLSNSKRIASTRGTA